MRKYDAAIFDLDGTLLDTAEGVFKSVEHVIKTLELPPISEEIKRTFIGPPMQKSFARVYGLSTEEARKAADVFRDTYKGEDLLLAKPYEGIFDTIKTLRDAGVKCAVATYKRQDYADRILEHFGFDKICDKICGSDFEGVLTKRDIIENAVKYLGVTDYSRAVMVGDSDNDAIGADEIKVPFIAVTYGFGFGNETDADAYPNVGVAATTGDIVRIIL